MSKIIGLIPKPSETKTDTTKTPETPKGGTINVDKNK